MQSSVGPFLRATALVSLFLVLCSSAGIGQPAQLRGKSILMSWSDTREERNVSTGAVRSNIRQVNDIRIYVSTAGRVFSEFTRSSGRNSDVKLAGTALESSRQILHWSFEGRSLVAYQHLTRGARRIAIDFDAGFATCSVSVVNGKEDGKPLLTENFQHTETKETVINVTSTSCAIHDGNVFGSEGAS
jgi:hypothetical protein